METVEFEMPTINEKGEIIARTRHSAEQFTEDLGNGIRLDMMVIPAGMYMALIMSLVHGGLMLYGSFSLFSINFGISIVIGVLVSLMNFWLYFLFMKKLEMNNT